MSQKRNFSDSCAEKENDNDDYNESKPERDHKEAEKLKRWNAISAKERRLARQIHRTSTQLFILKHRLKREIEEYKKECEDILNNN